MNFVLEDDQGVTIAMARSLEQLQRDFKQQISQGLEKAADQSTSRQGITEWDFDELPEEVALQHGKISIKAWPALRDCGDSVSLEVMDNPLQAEKVSRQGQLRLALLRGREQVKYLEKNLLRGKDLALKAANVGARQRLIDALISASFQQAVFSGYSVVRDQQQFDQAYEQGISQVVGLAQSYTESIETLLPRLHDLQKQLRGLGLPAIYAAEDIRNQLDWLFASETLCTITDEIISQYPRYINAIQVRVEKLTQQQSKDRQHIAEISDLLTDCRQALIEDQPLSSDLEVALLDYCWLVEEYRVSLFAQQLKTRVPVSLKRLNKRWLEVDEQLRRFRVQAG
jgi:ATP-dependent helicase HrpA